MAADSVVVLGGGNTAFSVYKTIAIELEPGQEGEASLAAVDGLATLVSREDGRITLRVAKEQTAKATERLLATLPIMDLTVEDPPIEEVIEQVFAQEAV